MSLPSVFTRALAVLVPLLCVVSTQAAPTSPYLDIEPYVTGMPATSRFTFDPVTGGMFVGNAASLGPIFAVPPGGGSFSTYGPSILDPDAVMFDTTGSVSGVPGAVLVGGQGTNVVAVKPDQTVISTNVGQIDNPSDFVFDHTGRLLITDNNLSSLVSYQSGVSQTIYQQNVAMKGLDVDSANNIYFSDNSGRIAELDSSGHMLNPSVATGLGASPAIAFGTGSGFGNYLYALGNDQLIRYDSAGDATVIGTGFGSFTDGFLFGPDGALYAGNGGDIYRITAVNIPPPPPPPPTPSLVHFTISAAESTITVSGTSQGAAINEIAPGSLATLLHGSLDVHIVPGSQITFDVANQITPSNQPGPFQPGNGPAQFAAQSTIAGSPAVGAWHNLAWSMTSSVQHAIDSTGAFSVANLNFSSLGGTLDYTYQGTTGSFPNGGGTNGNLTGSIVPFGSGYRMIIPFHYTVSVGGEVQTYDGQIVAYSTEVPEPSGLAIIGSLAVIAMLSLAQRRRR
jgi:hypothetical protein